MKKYFSGVMAMLCSLVLNAEPPSYFKENPEHPASPDLLCQHVIGKKISFQEWTLYLQDSSIRTSKQNALLWDLMIKKDLLRNYLTSLLSLPEGNEVKKIGDYSRNLEYCTNLYRDILLDYEDAKGISQRENQVNELGRKYEKEHTAEALENFRKAIFSRERNKFIWKLGIDRRRENAFVSAILHVHSGKPQKMNDVYEFSLLKKLTGLNLAAFIRERLPYKKDIAEQLDALSENQFSPEENQNLPQSMKFASNQKGGSEPSKNTQARVWISVPVCLLCGLFLWLKIRSRRNKD